MMLVALLIGCTSMEVPLDATIALDAPRRDAAGDAAADPMSDAPSSDTPASEDAPPSMSLGCPPSALLCEDFEDGSYGPDWILDASDAEVTVTSPAAHGGRAAHLSVAAHGGARALLRATSPFPISGNSFFGRAFVFLTGPAPSVHVGMFAAGGGPTEVRLGLGPTLLPNYATVGAEFGSWASDPPLMPVDRWTCIEWSYQDVGGDHDRLLYWIDGVEATRHEIDGTGSDAWAYPTFEQFELGLIPYHTEEAVTAYEVAYDDVVLATERIGCE